MIQESAQILFQYQSSWCIIAPEGDPNTSQAQGDILSLSSFLDLDLTRCQPWLAHWRHHVCLCNACSFWTNSAFIDSTLDHSPWPLSCTWFYLHLLQLLHLLLHLPFLYSSQRLDLMLSILSLIMISKLYSCDSSSQLGWTNSEFNSFLALCLVEYLWSSL